jgi:N-acetylglucosaminyl-diphospho-decaprenol L-rhamnosyltransferase
LLSDVTVVVPHYGDPGPTLLLIDRLARQRRVGLQVIVVDDHSPTPFPDTSGVDVVRRASNGGFGSTVNSGAALAKHDLLLILNSDVEFDDTFVAELVENASPWMPAVVSPRVQNRSGNDEWVGRHFPRIRHQFVEWLHPLARLRPRLHDAVGRDADALGSTSVVDWVAGVAMLIPTAAFRSIDGFDERFFMNSEEIDLQRRLRERGVPSVVLREPTLVHEGGGSTPTSSSRQWLVSSRLTYARKWSGATGEYALRGALLSASVINLAWGMLRALGGRHTYPVATFREELRLLRQASPERRQAR